MAHVADGTLRRMMDEPLAIADVDRRHYESCADCQARYELISADAAFARVALGVGPLREAGQAVDAGVALTRLQRRLAEGRIAPRRRHEVDWRSWLAKPAAAIALVGVLVAGFTLTPAGSWAQSVIQIFQPQQVVAIPVTNADLRTLPDLRPFGTVTAPKRLPSHTTTNLTDAEQWTGMHIAAPASLPSGIPSAVTYNLTQGGTASFTFSAARAQTWAAAHGKSLPAMPSAIDGSTLQLTVKPISVAWYGGRQDIPSLIVGQTPAPTLTSTRASVKEIEDYILNLPGVSRNLRNELEAIKNPTSTLPIPVPVNMATSQSVTVQGVPGVAIGDNTGIAAAVFWEKNGMMYGVGGMQSLNTVEQVANSLR